MDEDNDVDIDSDFDDDDEYNNEQSAASVANMTESERRAHHNRLERQRRDQIKESFSSLRDAVPTLVGERIGKASSASRAKILQSATEYIQQMIVANQVTVRDISELKRENRLLEQQVRNTERDIALRAKGVLPLPPTPPILNEDREYNGGAGGGMGGAYPHPADDSDTSEDSVPPPGRGGGGRGRAPNYPPRPRKKSRNSD